VVPTGHKPLELANAPLDRHVVPDQSCELRFIKVQRKKKEKIISNLATWTRACDTFMNKSGAKES